MKPIRLLLIGAMVVLGLAATGLPAQAELAENSGVVIFRGTATVCGETIAGKATNNDACDEDENNDKGKQGLYGPSNDWDNWTKRVGNYRFGSGLLEDPLTALNAMDECTAVGVNGIGQPPVLSTPSPMNKACKISVAGKLAPVAGVGAACGMSHGHSGTGELRLLKGAPALDRVYQLSNVGWVLSLVGTLPVTGTYQLKQVGDDSTKPKGGDPGKQGTQTDKYDNGTIKTRKITSNTASSGPFVAVVQAQGGQNCFKVPPGASTSGATTFNVIGVVKVF